jgi:hypothetical protein
MITRIIATVGHDYEVVTSARQGDIILSYVTVLFAPGPCKARIQSRVFESRLGRWIIVDLLWIRVMVIVPDLPHIIRGRIRRARIGSAGARDGDE